MLNSVPAYVLRYLEADYFRALFDSARISKKPAHEEIGIPNVDDHDWISKKAT